MARRERGCWATDKARCNKLLFKQDQQNIVDELSANAARSASQGALAVPVEVMLLPAVRYDARVVDRACASLLSAVNASCDGPCEISGGHSCLKSRGAAWLELAMRSSVDKSHHRRHARTAAGPRRRDVTLVRIVVLLLFDTEGVSAQSSPICYRDRVELPQRVVVLGLVVLDESLELRDVLKRSKVNHGRHAGGLSVAARRGWLGSSCAGCCCCCCC